MEKDKNGILRPKQNLTLGTDLVQLFSKNYLLLLGELLASLYDAVNLFLFYTM